MPELSKLTVYFAERSRYGDAFLAEAVLALLAERGVATSVLFRGIGSFGPSHIVRSDTSLTLSEDPPVVITAVDGTPVIERLITEVTSMVSRGLVTTERARSFDAAPAASDDEHVLFTLYLGRSRRTAGLPAHQAACAVLYRLGFAGATVFLGVDGTVGGQRHKAKFFSRNVDVPVQVVGVGTPDQAGAAAAELAGMFAEPLMTAERVRLCKRAGVLLTRPAEPMSDDESRFAKLTVYTAEDNLHDGVPIHRALIHRLRESRQVTGATVLRGLWGFRGTEEPHGDRLLTLGRHVPVATVVVDTVAAIARSFDIVDELTTEHGLVTVERVPLMLPLPHR